MLNRRTPWIAVVVICAIAESQVPIPPFEGVHSDGFEDIPAGNPGGCLTIPALDLTTQICSKGDPEVAVWGSWTIAGKCKRLPKSGVLFLGSLLGKGTLDGGTELRFSGTVDRFGGYYGQMNFGDPTVRVRFFSGTNPVGATVQLQDATACDWAWFGWDLTGLGVDRILFETNHPSKRDFALDDLELDLAGECHSTAYCTGKVNSLGCTPRIGSDSGCSSPLGNWSIQVDNFLNNRPGVIFFGTGPAALPFQGGTLCVRPPIQRSAVFSTAGSPPPDDCSGTLRVPFSFAHGSGPWYFQAWSRDGKAPGGSSLSNGLMIPVIP